MVNEEFTSASNGSRQNRCPQECARIGENFFDHTTSTIAECDGVEHFEETSNAAHHHQPSALWNFCRTDRLLFANRKLGGDDYYVLNRYGCDLSRQCQ